MEYTSGRAEVVHDQDYVFAVEHREKTMLRKGEWKIVNNNPPFHPDSFQLFKLSEDLAELYDLREEEKEKYSELMEEWSAFMSEIRVQFPTPLKEE